MWRITDKAGRRAVLVAAILTATPALADTNRIVCWTDDHGVRACGDHVPPEYSRKTRDFYNERGVLVQTIQGEATPEERAALEAKARSEKEARDQQAHDAFLLQSYRSVADLEAERDSRLASIETRLELAEKAVADGNSALSDLRARADEARTAGSDPDPALQKQIETFEAAHADDEHAVTALQQKRDALVAQYEHDIQRFLTLNSAPAAPAPPAR